MTLKKAGERRAKLLERTRRDVERAAIEKERVTRAADELRGELSAVLASTLEQLKASLGDESPPAPVAIASAAPSPERKESGTAVRAVRKTRGGRAASRP